MRRAAPLALALLLGLLAAAPAPAQAEADDEVAGPRFRGVALPLHSDDPGFDYGSRIVEIRALGATHVCLFVKLWQGHGRSPAPGRHPLLTPSDETVLRTMRQAQEQGLGVILVPMVLLREPGDGEWRGNLKPPSWSEWFAAYRREVVHLARLAQEGSAEVFAVGSELSSAERRTDQWLRVITAVRAVFSGELTYAANWDHYEHPDFWDQLDFIGLSAYYELTKFPDPPLHLLLDRWGQLRGRLERWRREEGHTQPLLFLEVGYPSQDGAAAWPWDYTRSEEVDLRLQEACYIAFVQTWRSAESCAGVLFYEWWGEGGPEDDGYTPRGKPAEDVMRRFFSGRPPQSWR